GQRLPQRTGVQRRVHLDVRQASDEAAVQEYQRLPLAFEAERLDIPCTERRGRAREWNEGLLNERSNAGEVPVLVLRRGESKRGKALDRRAALGAEPLRLAAAIDIVEERHVFGGARVASRDSDRCTGASDFGRVGGLRQNGVGHDLGHAASSSQS